MGAVFKKEGKYLRYGGHTTHTGTHRNAEWVDDLQQATVFHTMPSLRLRQDAQLQDAEKLEATETRTVTLTANALGNRLPATGAAIVKMQAEIDMLRERERRCQTMQEAEARSLLRALQEIASDLGLDTERASPAQIVDAVRALKPNAR